MNINVTEFVDDYTMCDFSASVAELGSQAAKITWDSALACPLQYVTKQNAADFRAYFGAFGAWERAEIAAWTLRDINALFLQMVAGAARDQGRDDYDPETDGGNLTHESDGWHYYVGI